MSVAHFLIVTVLRLSLIKICFSHANSLSLINGTQDLKIYSHVPSLHDSLSLSTSLCFSLSGTKLHEVLGVLVNELAKDPMNKHRVLTSFDNITRVVERFLELSCARTANNTSTATLSIAHVDDTSSDGSISESTTSKRGSSGDRPSGYQHSRTYSRQFKRRENWGSDANANAWRVIDWTALRRIRDHLDGICLLWMSNPDMEMRSHALKVMMLLANDRFNEAEQRHTGESPPVSMAAILHEPSRESGTICNPFWSSQLTAVLNHRHADFALTISWAWFRLSKGWNILKGRGEEDCFNDLDAFQLWMNNLRFLCSALRVPLQGDNPCAEELRFPPLGDEQVITVGHSINLSPYLCELPILECLFIERVFDHFVSMHVHVCNE